MLKKSLVDESLWYGETAIGYSNDWDFNLLGVFSDKTDINDNILNLMLSMFVKLLIFVSAMCLIPNQIWIAELILCKVY